jgi:hypothetical protein
MWCLPLTVASCSSATASEARIARARSRRREARMRTYSAVLSGDRAVDAQPVVQAREERAIATESLPVAEIGQTDEDERQERSVVPWYLSKLCPS